MSLAAIMAEFEDPYATIDDTRLDTNRFCDFKSPVFTPDVSHYDTEKGFTLPNDLGNNVSAKGRTENQRSTSSCQSGNKVLVNEDLYAVIDKTRSKNTASSSSDASGCTSADDGVFLTGDDLTNKHTAGVKSASNSPSCSPNHRRNNITINGDVYAIIDKNCNHVSGKMTFNHDDDHNDVMAEREVNIEEQAVNDVPCGLPEFQYNSKPNRSVSETSDPYVPMFSDNTLRHKVTGTINPLQRKEHESITKTSSDPMVLLSRRNLPFDSKGSNVLRKAAPSNDRAVPRRKRAGLIRPDFEPPDWEVLNNLRTMISSLDDITNTEHSQDNTREKIAAKDSSTASLIRSQENTLSFERLHNEEDLMPQYGRPRSRQLVSPCDDMLRKARQKEPLPPPPSPAVTSPCIRKPSGGRRRAYITLNDEPLPPPPTPPPPNISPPVRRAPPKNPLLSPSSLAREISPLGSPKRAVSPHSSCSSPTISSSKDSSLEKTIKVSPKAESLDLLLRAREMSRRNSEYSLICFCDAVNHIMSGNDFNYFPFHLLP